MRDGSTRDNSRHSLMIKGVLAMVAVVTALVLVSATACDTVARISIPDRTFSSVETVSVMPADGQCDDVGSIDGNATMRTVFFDNARADVPIKDGEEVSRTTVSMSRDDIEFDSGAIYSMPDVECSSNDDCPVLRCDAANGDSRCHRTTLVDPLGDPEFVGQAYDSQAFAVGISTQGRWRGWYSGDFSGYHVFNEDGPNESLESQPLDGPGEVAVDPGSVRGNALATDLADSWRDLSDYVIDDDQRDAYFGFWTFGESNAAVRSRVGDVSSGSWTTDSNTARQALGEMPGSSQGRTDIYDSLRLILQQGFSDDTVADADHKSLVFIVSGHDEVRRSDADQVISEAQEQGVAVSIVQVDAERDPDLLRDDWTYYEDEDPCESDDECKNFENCREPIMYTTDGTTNDINDVAYPREEQRGQTFCLPTHDEKGRLGPVADYQRIACETGGAYTYVPEAGRDEIYNPLRGLVFAPEAAWEFDIAIDQFGLFDGEEDAAGKPHLLETVMDVTIGRTQRDSFVKDDSGDTRRVFFTPVQGQEE